MYLDCCGSKRNPLFMWILAILGMTRVTFGASSSPFLLAATMRHHLKKYEKKYPEEVKMLNECLYVDDLITGADNVKNTLKLSQRAKECQ